MENSTKIKDPFPLRAMRWSYPKIEKIAPPLAHNIAWNLFFSPFKFKRPSRENLAFSSARISTVEINQKEANIFEWGTKGNPIVAMAHGWSGRATQFFKLIEPLVAAGFHVVSFDAPAHGLSQGKTTNIKEFNQIIEHIENTIGAINVGIGHSFGGVSLLYAKNQGISIETIVMVSSPTIGEDILNAFRKKINASPHTSTALREMVIKRFSLDFEEITACELAKSITLDHHLIIHDQNDLEVPFNNALALKEINQKAELYVTQKLGHTRILRDDQVVNKILDFINQASE